MNEGMTTDTTEAPSHAARRGGAEPEESAESSKAAGASEKAEEEGILSSDEETTDKKQQLNRKVVSDKPLMSQGGSREVRNFDSEGASKTLFDSHKAKEDVENKYSFGEQDLEYFGARLQQKAERETGVAAQIAKGQDEEEEKDYITQTDYQQEEMDKIDMHALNLFGVPLDDTSGKDMFKDVAASNKETQKALKDLINLTEELNGNSLSNFSLRKSFVYYDPYEPDQAV